MSFFKKLNKWMTKAEKKSFDAANTAHKWAVNGILIFIGYNFYTTIRDYNRSFKDARVRQKFVNNFLRISKNWKINKIDLNRSEAMFLKIRRN